MCQTCFASSSSSSIKWAQGMQALANASMGISLRQANTTLEVVHSQLAGYLSSKRTAWPRFHFISDTELLDILSHTRDVRAVQKHIPQLFEGATSLNLQGSGSSLDVIAMVSASGEELQLGRALKARGMPEGWLSNLEAAMRTHLRNAAKQGFRATLSMTSSADFCAWSLKNLNQIALLSFNLQWTTDVHSALSGVSRANVTSDTALQPPQKSSASARLAVVQDNTVAFIQCVSRMMSRSISLLHRQSLMSVMITVVHHRDVLSRLLSSPVTSELDFVWQSQLRCVVPTCLHFACGAAVVTSLV
jgi:dynein heavy chain, axonemal